MGNVMVESVIEGLCYGIWDYLFKLINILCLCSLFVWIFCLYELIDEVQLLWVLLCYLGCFGVLVGCSDVMQYVYDMIEYNVCIEMVVLFLGEVGIGKKLVVCMLYELSWCCKGLFVLFDCWMFVQVGCYGVLFDSVLFGYECGVFDGVECCELGLFE